MLVQTSVILILLTFVENFVRSDPILAPHLYIKFTRHGKRESVQNVEHIDEKLILDNKKLLIVRTKTLEVLHPQAVRNLKKLQDLVLAKCGIRRLEAGAFFNLPNLTTLHLRENEIREVKKGVFNKLGVRILSLHRNFIKQIDSQAFDDMPNLEKIKLNSNRLKFWDSSWFVNCPKLTELFFRRNKINFLPDGAFENVLKPNVKIYLSKNKLGQLNSTSFTGLSVISQLYLDRNGIEEVPAGAFPDLEQADVIYLSRNRISDINKSAFPKVRKIGILDLSSNLLECLPYELVTVTNLTNLEKNNGTCECVKEFRDRLKMEKRSSEIPLDPEYCPD